MPDVERWHATWKGLGVGSPEANLYAVVRTCYAESHRSYHTFQHLDECFVNFDEARHLADKVREIELALWFHDAVYEVRAQDNEEQSASWARDAAIQQGVASSVAERCFGVAFGWKPSALAITPLQPTSARRIKAASTLVGAARGGDTSVQGKGEILVCDGRIGTTASRIPRRTSSSVACSERRAGRIEIGTLSIR